MILYRHCTDNENNIKKGLNNLIEKVMYIKSFFTLFPCRHHGAFSGLLCRSGHHLLLFLDHSYDDKRCNTGK